MLLRCLRAELIKFRRSPVWLAFVVLEILVVVSEGARLAD